MEIYEAQSGAPSSTEQKHLSKDGEWRLTKIKCKKSNEHIPTDLPLQRCSAE